MKFKDLVNVVSMHTGASPERIYKRNEFGKLIQKREYCEARQIIHWYLCKDLTTRETFAEIGKKTGGVAHSDVIYSIKIMNDMFRFNKGYKEKIFNLLKINGTTTRI